MKKSELKQIIKEELLKEFDANLHRDLKPFIEIAKKVKDGKEFIKKARNIQVPMEVSKRFFDMYDKGRGDMFKAADEFVNDVKKGNWDK